MNWIVWALSLAGGLGLAGLIALAIFAPAVALVVWQALARLFWRIVATRTGCAVLALLAGLYAGSLYQHRLDKAEWARQSAAFRAAQAARDARIEADTKSFVLKQVADEYMAQQESAHDRDAFKKGLDPRGKCRIGDDAPGLRQLIGDRRSQGRDHQGVRKPAAKKGVP